MSRRKGSFYPAKKVLPGIKAKRGGTNCLRLQNLHCAAANLSPNDDACAAARTAPRTKNVRSCSGKQ